MHVALAATSPSALRRVRFRPHSSATRPSKPASVRWSAELGLRLIQKGTVSSAISSTNACLTRLGERELPSGAHSVRPSWNSNRRRQLVFFLKITLALIAISVGAGA